MHHNRTWPLDLILLRTQRNRILPVTGGVFELKAAPDTTTSTSLTWTEASPKPDTYRIERSTDGISFSTVTSAGADIFSYTDTGRTESTEYYYRIVPVLDGADQPASNVASTWTVPSTPTGLTATAISSTQINLAWTDVSTGNTAQSIQRRSPAGSGSYSFIASVGATATSYNDTLLTPSTQYEYQVAATNPATQSAWSTAANATTTGGGPPSPSWTLDFSTGEPWANGTNYVFSSTASTTRTFVNSSGYVAPCVANRWTNSEVIASWPTVTISNCNTAANSTAAPDGTTTADTVSATTTNASHFVRGQAAGTSSISGANHTWSVYLKAGGGVGATYGYIAVESSGTPDRTTRVIYDLTTGARTQELSSNSPTGVESPAQAENCGNGWWRVWLRQDINGTSHQRCFVGLTNVSTSASLFPAFAGAASDADFIYVWGAQYVIGSAALPYSKTTTSSNGIPRLTHNSSGSRLGLLVEPQRTNVCQRSEELGNAYWTATNVTVTTNSIAAPDNQTTAELLLETVSSGAHAIFVNGNITGLGNGTAKTISCFVKKQNRSQVALQFRGVGGTSRATQLFDIDGGVKVGSIRTNGTPTATASGIENYGNGWYRIWITATISGSAEVGFIILISNTTGTTEPTWSAINQPEYTGNTANGLYVWGCQAEDGVSTPSSYIPTTTASVTRQADIAYLGAVTNFGRPGSFVVEYYKPTEPNGHVLVAEDDVGSGGRLGLAYSSGGPRIIFGTTSAGSGATDTAGLNKVGWAWDGSGAATRSAINGAAWDTSLATSFDPSTVTSIGLGGNVSDPGTLPITVSEQPNVIVRKITFYDSQLSAADLNTLTGPTSYTVDALVVAGGGGGSGNNGGGGGGGAGGYRTATGFSLTVGTSYTVTVGAGGGNAAAGNNSVFSTITSDGGGKGGDGFGNGGNGGSGGGGGGWGAGTTTGGTGTSGQGNNGGGNGSLANPFPAGGGGGASAAGANGAAGGIGGNGGDGTASSITGTSVTRAGGGGGGVYVQNAGTPGTGGAGGGGNGSNNNTGGTAGGANTGGGGGGGAVGRAGGSGVVILRMATANYSGVHTPATVTTSGSDTILTFTSSGTYTA